MIIFIFSENRKLLKEKKDILPGVRTRAALVASSDTNHWAKKKKKKTGKIFDIISVSSISSSL